jgi:hypothetical protein
MTNSRKNFSQPGIVDAGTCIERWWNDIDGEKPKYSE